MGWFTAIFHLNKVAHRHSNIMTKQKAVLAGLPKPSLRPYLDMPVKAIKAKLLKELSKSSIPTLMERSATMSWKKF